MKEHARTGKFRAAKKNTGPQKKSQPLRLSSTAKPQPANPVDAESPSLRDITERKRAKEALRESEGTFRALTENSEDVIMRFDRKGRHLYANPSVERQTGIPPAEFIGKTHAELGFPPELCALWEEAIQKVFLSKAANRIEFKLPNGMAIDWLLVPEMNERGEVKTVITCARDISEMKKAQDQLQHAQQQLHDIIEFLPDATFVVDKEKRVIAWNRSVEQMTGVRKEDILGRTTYSLCFYNELRPILVDIALEPHERIKVNYPALEIEGNEVRGEAYVPKAWGVQGAYCWGTASKLFDTKGNVIGAIESIRNITMRKRAEEALRESEAKLSSIFRAAPIAIGILGPDRKFLFVNNRVVEMFGYSSEELVGDTSRKLYGSQEEYERIGQALYGTLRQQDIAQTDSRMRRKDGTEIYVLLNAAPLQSDEPKLGVVVTVLDITARKRAEEELRQLTESLDQRVKDRTLELEESRRVALSMMQDADHQRQQVENARQELEKSTERLRLLSQAIENSRATVFITDKEGRIEYVNPAFTKITGFTAEEVVGQNPRLLKSEIHPPEFYAEMWATISSGKSWRGDICNKKKNGELYWVSVSIAPVMSPTGEVRHYVAVREDITERRQIAEELRKAKDAAETANRAKSAFLANMSHEIRTPMNAILGYTQLMQLMPALTPRQNEYLQTISRSGEHLLMLINEVLEMSKIEAGRTVLNSTAFDFQDLLSELETMFRVRIEAKRLQFDVKQVGDVPRHLHADEGKIRQVLINMLSNAVKFTERGGIVARVCARRLSAEQTRMVVEVEDTGCGIAEGELEKVFNYFEQTASGRRKQEGTGLGMAISRSYARLMGGDLTVESQEGKESTFRFEFQARLGAEPARQPATPRRVVSGIAHHDKEWKVLVVDDNPTDRDVASQMLQRVGFVVREAEDGEQALRVFEAWRPHVVLMDMRMPGMNGLETICRIKSLPGGETTPILIVSASVLEESRRQEIAANVSAFVTKPFREEDLLEWIRRVIGIEYTYETKEPATVSGISHLKPEDLKALPSTLLDAMRQAIESGDTATLMGTISEVEKDHAAEGNVLRALANHYDYEALLKLLGGPV